MIAKSIHHFVVPFYYQMPVQKTHAIVIRAFPLGEFDKIITFYTADFGKVRAVARSIRRPKSRFGGSLELLNYGTLLFFERPNKDLQIVNNFDLIDAFDGIKADYDRTIYGCYLAELIDAIESEHSINRDIFELLRDAFDALGDVHDMTLLARAFELKFLDLIGYAPQLSHCVACASPVLNPVLLFSSRLGGLLCTDCADKDTNSVSIARGSCELMKQIRRFHLRYLTRLRASDRNHRELKFVLSSFISYHTERTLKSLKLIENLET